MVTKMKFSDFQELNEARAKKAKAEYIEGPTRNSPKFTFETMGVYFTITLSANNTQVYKHLPGNVHPAFTEVHLASNHKSNNDLVTPVLDFVRKNIGLTEITNQLKELGLVIATGRKFYNQNITDIKVVRKDEDIRFKAQTKADPKDQSRLSANYDYDDHDSTLVKKAERIIKSAVTKLFKEHGDKLVGDQKAEEPKKSSAKKEAPKKVEVKDDDIFDNHNIKSGITIKVRTRLDGVQEGVVTDGFEIDDDGDLTIGWRSNKDKDEYWAYDNQIVSLNGKPYSTYKAQVEKLFKK